MKSILFVTFALLGLALAGCGSGETSSASTPAGAASPETGEPAKEGEAAHEERVKLTDEQLKESGIGLAQAGPAEIRTTVPLYGVIAPNAESVREVGARFPGIIRSVSKRIGDAVKQGEVLATVESNESLQTYNVVAPLTGVVTARQANSGEQTGERSLFTVADLSTVWVELSLFPRDLPKVRVGQTVRVKGADSNFTAEGKVVYVAPFGTSANQTLTARVLLSNPDRKWAPGLYVTAEVTVGTAAVPLAVSTAALQTFQGKTVVFVQTDEGFEPRSLRVGRSDGQFTEVLSGVKAGETYATHNSFILKAELGKSEAAEED